jgi:hypothetical protein
VSGQIVPIGVRLAARRAFIRSTAQGYAATLGGSITTTAVLALVRGEVDPLTVGVTVGVAAVTPLLAGAAAYASFIAKGIPEDYQG